MPDELDIPPLDTVANPVEVAIDRPRVAAGRAGQVAAVAAASCSRWRAVHRSHTRGGRGGSELLALAGAGRRPAIDPVEIAQHVSRWPRSRSMHRGGGPAAAREATSRQVR